MRILIPNFSPPDTFVHNVTHTLRNMGHEVVNLGVKSNSRMNSPYLRIMREAMNKVTGNFLSPQEKWLRKHYASIKPDLVLTLTQALDEETLHLLKKSGIRTAVWWGDPASNMKNRGLLQPGWDLLFIKDEYATFKLRTVGLPAFHLFEAMNPDWHKVVSLQKNNSVVIAGNFYDYRHYLVSKLIAQNVELSLYGGRLPGWASESIKRIHTGKYIVCEEKSRVFGEGLAVLNSTSMNEHDSVNCRAFEAAGAGALQIMEYRPSIEKCFEPGKEILVYKTYEELLELIEKAKRFPQEMNKIRMGASRRALAEHTYQHRLEVILKMVREL